MGTSTILRLPDVIYKTGKSRSSIYLDMSEGTFPTPIKLGLRSVGWIESEIEDWINNRLEISRNTASKGA